MPVFKCASGELGKTNPSLANVCNARSKKIFRYQGAAAQTVPMFSIVCAIYSIQYTRFSYDAVVGIHNDYFFNVHF